MKSATLADRLADLSKVKLGKINVRVPKLDIKSKPRPQKAKRDMPISSIINILIKNAVEKAKKEKKEEKPSVVEDKSYKTLKDDKPEVNGGYGSSSKSYGMSSRASYTDYGKLFSHVGTFRAKQPYEEMGDHVGTINKAGESSSFTLVDGETLQKGGWFVKYRAHPGKFDLYTALGSLVSPIPELSSIEWEKFKLMMMIDKSMYALKTSTS